MALPLEPDSGPYHIVGDANSKAIAALESPTPPGTKVSSVLNSWIPFTDPRTISSLKRLGDGTFSIVNDATGLFVNPPDDDTGVAVFLPVEYGWKFEHADNELWNIKKPDEDCYLKPSLDRSAGPSSVFVNPGSKFASWSLRPLETY
ncbi:hypothetical protein SISNIDRAFT_471545 [Sistotremastrum niveocremeum HHB9708]|uniref:Uncharacterized protein n=1 Tax=Sistotremastrum niveocremeum HHB9708 TaxID=1314777 RepID=A0A164MI49_9AGAM|nr:hypothetical protein SISNIDRAFT_471545 [Sistotremastrum niveocremeum HHB9708]